MTHGHSFPSCPGEYGRGSHECDPGQGTRGERRRWRRTQRCREVFGPGDRARTTPGSGDTEERVAAIHVATQVGMGETRDFTGVGKCPFLEVLDITKANICWRLYSLFSWVMFNWNIYQPLFHGNFANKREDRIDSKSLMIGLNGGTLGNTGMLGMS